MDFGRPHLVNESVTSRSKIRHIPLEEASQHSLATDPENAADKELDERVLQAANKAARNMILGNTVRNNDDDAHTLSLIDTSHYKEHMLPPQETIQEGDLVVIMISFDTLKFVYAKKDDIVSNRNGHFHHNDFLGKPFGCKVRSRNNRGYGFCYLLKPTPELWVRSLNHRTQIVHELDQSQIVFQLQLRPNAVVVESGTGSGAVSYAILRSIAPHGHLHTYEFNPHRADTARDEFQLHGLSHLVTVRHRDVCASGFEGCGPASVDAVFLDLPEPWNAIPHAAHCLKPNGRIANYSPCIEQTQRAVLALEAAGFHSIQTMEYRLMENYVDHVTYQPPPRLIRPCLLDKSRDAPEQSRPKRKDAPETTQAEVEEPQSKTPKTNEGASDRNTKNTDGNGDMAESQPDSTLPQTKTMTVARPFGLMRGHTAFLTFATAGLIPQPKKATSATTVEDTAKESTQ